MYKKRWDLGYKELEKPIRHGWFIQLTILRKIERYKFKPEIDEIVDKLETSIWGATKEKAQLKWNNARSKHLIYKDVPTISPKTYRKLSDKAKRHCTLFFYKEHKKWRRRYYVRIRKNVYKISFKRAYVTHSKIIDPNLEERLDVIHQQYLKDGWYGLSWAGEKYCPGWGACERKSERIETKRKLKRHQYTSLNEIKKEY